MSARNVWLSDPGLERLRTRIDERLREVTRSQDPVMDEMASHLVSAGGKRLRPIVAALSSVSGASGGAYLAPGTTVSPALRGRSGHGRPQKHFLDEVSEAAITGAVATELVHAGSLHHDDVIDEAGTRHGVDSVNARWGNLRAILSGDYLLARASELAASLGSEVAGLLASTIGRLCEGEVRELHFAYRMDRSEEDYFAAIEGKTAALYATAAKTGALVSKLPWEEVEALTEFGQLFGMAFQVVDDVLDVVSTDGELGKPAGHDMVEGVYTLPVLRLLQEPDANPAAAELRSLLGKPLDDAARIRALELVRGGGGVAASVEVAKGFVDKAVERLASVGPSPAVDILGEGARSLVTGV